MEQPWDLLVVGGGINGVGIARDAAGRGLRVALCEMHDLAGGTSSASSKLIHGGLRYLEKLQLRLVRESLLERDVLLATAPHLVRPLRFVLPHHAALRPACMLRLGLLLYDALGNGKATPARRRLPRSRGVRLDAVSAAAALQPQYRRGFEYSDCQVDDARLVVLAALDAAERGATILTRSRCIGARRERGLWRIELQERTGNRRTHLARALVNAAGPRVEDLLPRPRTASGARRVRLVKGSHIVVPRLYPDGHAYALQSGDGRVVFVIPYQQHFTLIGTTDVALADMNAPVRASEEEIAYLCSTVSGYLRRPVAPADVAWAYAGVRSLHDSGESDAAAISRDYVLDQDAPDGEAPLLSVIGGKITTHRRLAEQALAWLVPLLGRGGVPWTRTAALPGGDMPEADFDTFRADIVRRYAWLPATTAARLSHAYGTRVERILDGACAEEDLGEHFGAGLFEAELDYLRRCEWAVCAEDVLWRRTRLGLMLDAAGQQRVAAWMARA